ncbi:hypothetical protein FGO68_gene9987 [Halteria grandinella]|uniref:Uncharacterized protein n=1 Tax=Halteria grandinella TaxID=5974 RepID=A0A8J8P3I0_HALGN|nr:hypothetical protein FGO68_gene9987 [Halteria grandinella]
MFIIIWFGISGAQVLIIEVGSFALKVSNEGLAGEHWAIAFGAGLSTWIVGFFIKMIPDTWCPQFGVKKQDPLSADNQHGVLSLRKNRTSSYQLRQGMSIQNKGEQVMRQGSRQVSLH